MGVCIERNLWISARNLPGTENIYADRASRNFDDDIEWTLDRNNLMHF